MKGIIFDFNGTLYWDSQLHYDAWKKFSKILRGYEFTDKEMREKMFGHTNREIIKYAIGKEPSSEMVEKYAQEKEQLYRESCLEHKEQFKLADGAIELLDYLKEQNIPHAIATMSEWSNVEFYIKEFKLEKWFDIDNIIYSDGTMPGKPAPDIFLKATKQIHLEPKDCIVVEDALAGIMSAKAAGISKIIAIASIEPVEYYQKIDGVNSIIKNFYEFDKTLLEDKSLLFE